MNAVVTGFRVTAPHFIAGGEIRNDVVIRVAPILNYMRGWMSKQVQDYCDIKGWTVEKV